VSTSTTTSIDRSAWGNAALCGLLALLAVGLLRMHASEWEWQAPGVARWLYATGALFLWSGFTGWTVWRRRSTRDGRWIAQSDQSDDTLVVFASQTGTA